MGSAPGDVSRRYLLPRYVRSSFAALLALFSLLLIDAAAGQVLARPAVGFASCRIAGGDIGGCLGVPAPDSEEELEDEAAPSVMLLQTTLSQQRRPRSTAEATTAVQHTPAALQTDARIDRVQEAVVGSPPTARRPDVLSHSFVFLFEWSWDDVAKECESWLGPKGFNAVLVSPPNEHVVGSSWDTRYQPVSYNLTSRSGNEIQFASMIQRCNAAGVGVYADTVFNHCAAESGRGVGGSSFRSRTYPMYGPEDFHHIAGNTASNCGVTDYYNQTNVQYCDLMGMPDLCTGCERVQKSVAAYINRMGELGISGYRVDAAKHMDPKELGSLLKYVDSSLYSFLEVSASPGEIVQAPMYYPYAPVTEFGFAATVAPKFSGSGLLRDDLVKIGEDWGLAPSSEAVVFLDNHDTQRSGAAPLTYKNGTLYDLTSIFMLAYPYGYPKVMSSYYFETEQEAPPTEPVHERDGNVNCGPTSPWVCEHRRLPIANMVAWRRAAGEASINNFVSEGSTVAFCRGEVACVALNLMNTTWEPELQVSLPEGSYCNVIQSEDEGCPVIKVDASGTTRLEVPARGAVAFHVNALTEGSEDNYEDSFPLQ